MNFVLRCNSLKCRDQLKDSAVVTTCSHVFCVQCAELLNLTIQARERRVCPACQSILPNQNDVVATTLNPSDDYKSSVLGGLSPNLIIECASRALAFWSYQSSQEIVYQEYLARTLTEKHNGLNNQMDQIVHSANAEIDLLTQKISGMQLDHDRLRAENQNLSNILKEKDKKSQQIQELYDGLKCKEMTAITKSAAHSAAMESVGGVIFPRGDRGGHNIHHTGSPNPFSPGFDWNGAERVHTHQKSGSPRNPRVGRLMLSPSRSASLMDVTETRNGTTPSRPSTPLAHYNQLGNTTPIRYEPQAGVDQGRLRGVRRAHDRPFSRLSRLPLATSESEQVFDATEHGLCRQSEPTPRAPV